ncbi:MAG: tetratricopeptide repeat protein, partial [Richelia sp. SM1_7_0]|nr:tetratricopeptide repeat protein [Richelia sp. SM1_7_0]
QETLPLQWARTQNNLANAYYSRIKGDKTENIEKAIFASENALKIFTKEALPTEWATTQNSFAAAYSDRTQRR